MPSDHLLSAIINDDPALLHTIEDLYLVEYEHQLVPTIGLAVAFKRERTIRFLVRERGVDVDAAFEFYRTAHTPLTLAIHHRHVRLIPLLIELGADLCASPRPCSPLMNAIHKKLPLETLFDLLQHGARFDQTHDPAPLRKALALTSETRRLIRLVALFWRTGQITPRDVQAADHATALEFYASLVPQHDEFECEMRILLAFGLEPTETAVRNALETAARCRAVGMCGDRSERMAVLLSDAREDHQRVLGPHQLRPVKNAD